MADNDIIDFYKKADNDNKPEEPLKEQVETPEPVVSEAVSVPVPESNDPFDKFLFNLAEKLKTEKKITEQQQQQFNERVVQPTTNPEDPFAKFLESFAGLVKEDENINKEENIKEATIDFINKLKNDDFFDYKKEKPKEDVKPEPKKKPKKYLPPKFVKKIEKVEEELPVTEQSTEPEPEQSSNPYLKELQTADKKKSKVEDKISGLSDIKKIISQQVQEQLSKYPNLGFTGGGGGTNAVQYAQGGTMNGDLTVNGTVNATTYLSGGTNLFNILSSSGGGGGAADRLTSGSAEFILDPDGKLHPLDNDLLTLQSENAALSAYTRIVLSPYGFFAYDNNSNSITFDSISDDIVITSQDLYEWTFNSEGKLVGPSGTLAVSGNVDVTNKFLSGGVDLADIFITSAEESQTLAYDTQTELLSITRGNSVSLASLNDKSYVNANFLALSGGLVSGPVRINNNLTVFGNLTATGTTTFANTVFSVTSSLSVVHIGSGPALYVGNNGDGDIASFYDIDQNVEVLHVGGINSSFPNVGIRVSNPNKTLTVAGEISATQDITTSGKFYIQNDGNSDQWNQAYNISTAYQSASSSFATNTTVNSVSSLLTPLTLTNTLTSQLLPTSVYQNASGTFATIAFSDSKYLPLSGGTITGNLDVQGQILSGGININQLLSSSGGGGGDPAVNTVVYTTSATWNNTTTAVQSNSASWFEPVRRFDYVTVASVDISYSGTAPFGTADNNPIWKLIRLTYNNNGTISNSASALNSWTGRLTATYV